MNYRIGENSSTPAYLQLYTFLRRDITAGSYLFGQKLPSKRIAAMELGLSVITVEHAYDLLCEEGYAEGRQRSGYFVIYRREDFQGGELPGEEGQRRSHRDRKGNGAEQGESTAGTMPYSILSRTARRVLQDYEDRLLRRSPNAGCPELREEICRYLRRNRGLQIAPEQVVIGSGAEYLYGLIAQMFRDGRIFGLEDPGYEKIRSVYEKMGIPCDRLPLRENGIASGALRTTEATVLHVTPFHSYPSGVTADISKRLEYVEWARDRNGILIEDNFDSELTVSKKPEDPLFSLSEDVPIIYLNTFSRTIAPSLRIGYMILPEVLRKKFTEELGFYSCTVPLFEQYLLLELLKSGDFERHINRIRREKRKKTGLTQDTKQ